MSEAVLVVARAGPLVSLQDGGRPGLMRFGVPASGPMDRLALAAANVALGNAATATGIEVSLGGLRLDCLRGAVDLATAGGHFLVDCGERRGASWSRMTIRAGESLTVRPGPWGSWCVIAFAGRLRAPTWLGSQSTHSQSGLGGGLLVAGAEVIVTDARAGERAPGDFACPVFARPRRDYHVVLGPQDRFFAPAALASLASATYRLSDAYDRMGVRLQGPALPPEAALSIPSEPIARGSIQVSGDGTPTILLADHQTTGGYPKIATLLSDEVDRLAQLRPRAALRFSPVTPDEAVAMLRRRQRLRAAYLAELADRR